MPMDISSFSSHILELYPLWRLQTTFSSYLYYFTLQRMSRGLSNISKGIPTCKNPKHFPHAASLLVLIISFMSSTFPCVTYINLNKKISMQAFKLQQVYEIIPWGHNWILCSSRPMLSILNLSTAPTLFSSAFKISNY